MISFVVCNETCLNITNSPTFSSCYHREDIFDLRKMQLFPITMSPIDGDLRHVEFRADLPRCD